MEIQWVMTGHITAVSRELTVFRARSLPMHKEVIVPRRGMKAGRPRVRYYLGDDPREFRTESEVVAAFEINCKKEIP